MSSSIAVCTHIFPKYLPLVGGFFLFIKIFYLFIHKRYRERGRDRQREKQTPCGEPNTGLDPRTLGLCPASKADTQPLSHPGIPITLCFGVISTLCFGDIYRNVSKQTNKQKYLQKCCKTSRRIPT